MTVSARHTLAVGLLAIVAAGLTGGVAQAQGVNLVGRIEARADGDRTVIVVHGSAVPSFTAYRLERPSRLVVDLANGRIGKDPSLDGLLDVDSWAVSQVATAQYHTEQVKTARVMIGLKRGCTYDVKAHGNDLHVTLTATDPAPAGMIEASGKKAKDAERVALAAETRRNEVLAQLADEEKRLGALREARAEEERRAKKQGDAAKVEADANRRAEAARIEAETAKARAFAARAELERLQITRAAEETKIAELQRRAAAGGAREQHELDRLRGEAAREQARLTQLKAEAERVAERRAVELKKIDEVQAQARRSAEERARTLDQARAAADQRASDAASARLAEERRAQVQMEEAARLRSTAEATRRLAHSEAARQTAELAAKRAADQAKLDEERVAKLRLEAERIARQAEVAHAEVDAAKLEASKLVETQIKERARIESARTEARRLADQRQLEIERAAHATALYSGERAKIEASEREAKRLAELRQKESLRLDSIRKSTEEAATARAEELRRLEDARASQKATVAAHERELKSLADRRDRELRALTEARAGEEAKIAAARDEMTRTRAELNALEAQRAVQRAELERATLRTKQAADEAQRAELERTTLRTKLAADEAQRAVQRAELERATLRTKQATDEAQRAELERATLRAKLAQAQAEAAQAEAVHRKAMAAVTPVVAPVPAQPQSVLSARSKELARTGQHPSATVRDVRFADDAEAHRVVIDLQGEPDWRTTPSQRGEMTLRLSGAELPRRLERTLDTAAYKGPVRAVSTYSDPADPGAVKVVVALDPAAKGGEPRVIKEGNRLVWEFPREAHATSIAPTRVSGYGASIPLQMAATTSTNLNSPSQSGRRRLSYSGRRIDLDFKDFDIHNILRLLSDVGQVNIITADDVKGTITIRMRDVPWDQALDVILKSKGLGMQREGNLIRVAPMAALEKEMEAEIARAKAAIELKPLDTRLIPLSYAQGDKMMPRVQELLSSRGKVSVDDRTNMLIVSDVASNIALAEDLVRNLDTQTPQVLIEARVVEARQTFTRTIGIQWGGNTLNSASTGNPTGLVFPSTIGVAGAATDALAPTAGLQTGAANPNYMVNLPAPIGTGSGGGLGLTLGSLAGTFNINLRLSALESTGQVRIVSAPKITTLDNVEATIEQGVAIPISVVSAAGTNTIFVDAKLNLTVKPHVTNEGSVVMKVNITRNEPDFVNVGARGDPTILKKQAKTEMLVRDGDTAVIGGIYTRNSGMAYQKLPWVADIPILGWLFKNRRENDDRTELLIFITPRIVNRQMVAR